MKKELKFTAAERLAIITEQKICPECGKKLEEKGYKNRTILWCETCKNLKYVY